MEFRCLIIIIIKLNKKNLQILLQDKYNIGVLTVNIELRWLGTKRPAKSRLSIRF